MHKNVEKMSINYSPNFDLKKRTSSKVKYLIFHYTGMRSENAAIKRLTSKSSKVSCHYFIKKNGEIVKIVPDLYIAWHAGYSSWKKDQFINLNSKSDKSLLQQTQERLQDLRNISDPILICNERHRFIVAEQMRAIGVQPTSILLEPLSKNTAPAITIAAMKAIEYIKDEDPMKRTDFKIFNESLIIKDILSRSSFNIFKPLI